MSLSTRARLTLYYAVVLALSLAAFAIALRVVTGAALLRSLDNSLVAATQIVQVDTESGAPSFAQQQDTPMLQQGLVTLVLFDSQGRITGRKGASAPSPPPIAPAGFTSSDGWRIYTTTIPRGTLRAYRSLGEFQATITALDRIIAAGIPLLVLLAAGAGWWLARKALQPVGAVMRTATEIAQSGDPRRRVPVRAGNDEMARMVDLINAMLTRLEDVILRERAFANAAAHQLRTPLAVIRGRADLAQQQPRTTASYRATLDTIERKAAEMQIIVTSLLGLARTATLQTRPTPLGPILTRALETAETQASERNQTIDADFSDTTMQADAALVQQAVAALLDNAIKFTPTGGRIHLHALITGPNVDIIVEDNGPGIPEATRERLLQPFQRGEAQQSIEGAGLGLALAHEVARAHGGELHLDDSPLGGLAARITFRRNRQETDSLSGPREKTHRLTREPTEAQSRAPTNDDA